VWRGGPAIERATESAPGRAELGHDQGAVPRAPLRARWRRSGRAKSAAHFARMESGTGPERHNPWPAPSSDCGCSLGIGKRERTATEEKGSGDGRCRLDLNARPGVEVQRDYPGLPCALEATFFFRLLAGRFALCPAQRAAASLFPSWLRAFGDASSHRL
jgi:hypothetical protein